MRLSRSNDRGRLDAGFLPRVNQANFRLKFASRPYLEVPSHGHDIIHHDLMVAAKKQNLVRLHVVPPIIRGLEWLDVWILWGAAHEGARPVLEMRRDEDVAFLASEIGRRRVFEGHPWRYQHRAAQVRADVKSRNAWVRMGYVGKQAERKITAGRVAADKDLISLISFLG